MGAPLNFLYEKGQMIHFHATQFANVYVQARGFRIHWLLHRCVAFGAWLIRLETETHCLILIARRRVYKTDTFLAVWQAMKRDKNLK